MPKQSRTLAALTGVIAGGIRRRPVYIREQALVSKLYPLFMGAEKARADNTIFSAELIYQRKPIETSVVEQVGTANFIYSALLRSVVIELNPTETVESTNAIYESLFRLARVSVMAGEKVGATNAVFEAEMPRAGIYLNASEGAVGANTIYEAYRGK